MISKITLLSGNTRIRIINLKVPVYRIHSVVYRYLFKLGSKPHHKMFPAVDYITRRKIE